MEATLAVRMGTDKTWGIALSRSWGRRLDGLLRRPLGALLVGIVIVTAGTTTRGIITTSEGPRMSVIVRAISGGEDAVERAVERLGGTVGIRLRIIDGFSAMIPASAVALLGEEPSVLSVTPNSPARLMGSSYDASSDPYSLRDAAGAIRADSMWTAGYTGKGVDVALIDSGIAPVQGLAEPGQYLDGPDLSPESQSPTFRHLDTFGHGTHMAGIIAGRDPAAIPGTYGSDWTNFLGIAPDARILSVKVADAHGNTDVSQVIAGIDWVVQHAHDPGLDVRVLNISFGTPSTQSYLLDPLAYAAEVAWRRGIAVVAAAGNAGLTTSGLPSPAYDPFLIAAGAADDHGSPQYSQWTVCTFSQTGDGIRNPDILAPGAHLQSLRVPGSYIDDTFPEGVINDRFLRGSGSSQAAAMVSGVLALMFQEHPNMTPDQAKKLLMDKGNSLRPKAGFSSEQGQLAVRLDGMPLASVPTYVQTLAQSTGVGALEGSRGTVHLVQGDVTLQGEKDIFGHPFASAVMAALEATGSSWSGGTWNGSSWSGNSWSGSSWSSVTWSGNSWSGSSWSAVSWSGKSWSGNSWSGSSWSGNSWSGNSWSGSSWSSSWWG
jgi:serine protease AprX